MQSVIVSTTDEGRPASESRTQLLADDHHSTWDTVFRVEEVLEKAKKELELAAESDVFANRDASTILALKGLNIWLASAFAEVQVLLQRRLIL